MEYRKVSNTDLYTSRIALGCRSFAGGLYWGVQDEDDSIGTVLSALDLGINSFDTSPSYGNGLSEEVLGKALFGRRDQALIISSLDTRVADVDSLIRSCENSLWRLRTDRIDFLQVDPSRMAIAKNDLMVGIELLQGRGMIREFGILNSDQNRVEEFDGAAFVEASCSLLNRDALHRVSGVCASKSMGLFAYAPLQHGLLSGSYYDLNEIPTNRRVLVGMDPARADNSRRKSNVFSVIEKLDEISKSSGVKMNHLALAWALNRPAVTSVVVGARMPHQIVDNVSVLDQKISDEILREIDAAGSNIFHPVEAVAL
ncbi:aldo/keto reductase [Puniceicoccaceae bacterium K14]|nr:aldo/keto reductase [Puniceicoccaceae bacterium K14]